MLIRVKKICRMFKVLIWIFNHCSAIMLCEGQQQPEKLMLFYQCSITTPCFFLIFECSCYPWLSPLKACDDLPWTESQAHIQWGPLHLIRQRRSKSEPIIHTENGPFTGEINLDRCLKSCSLIPALLKNKFENPMFCWKEPSWRTELNQQVNHQK